MLECTQYLLGMKRQIVTPVGLISAARTPIEGENPLDRVTNYGFKVGKCNAK